MLQREVADLGNLLGWRGLTGSTGDVFDSDTLDSYVEEERSAGKSLYEAHLGYKEARDTLNRVRQGRGFWPVIAIPATRRPFIDPVCTER